MKCGTYQFVDITGRPYPQLYPPEPNVITIPLSPGENLNAVWIKANFTDSDTWSSDDPFASFAERAVGAYVPQVGQRWTGGDPVHCTVTRQSPYSNFDEAVSMLTFTFSVYPNPCRDIPPDQGF
jgi:hypothetical protein